MVFIQQVTHGQHNELSDTVHKRHQGNITNALQVCAPSHAGKQEHQKVSNKHDAVNQSASPPISQPVSLSVSQPVKQSVSSASHPVSQSVSQSVSQPASQPTHLSTNRFVRARSTLHKGKQTNRKLKRTSQDSLDFALMIWRSQPFTREAMVSMITCC